MGASDDVTRLQSQIQGLSASILSTLTEVATIRHPMMEDDRVLAAVDELDAIVTATEVATDQILGATERLDELKSSLDAGTADTAAAARRINEVTTAIYEAANFQDITGQRIGKVMALLRDVDLRVMAMIEHLGGDMALADVAPPSAAKQGDAALVNGPQASHQALAQEAVDSLFD